MERLGRWRDKFVGLRRREISSVALDYVRNKGWANEPALCRYSERRKLVRGKVSWTGWCERSFYLYL